LDRACSAETTMLPFFAVRNMNNSPVRRNELYGSILREVD
jgi:hypothetical protein